MEKKLTEIPAQNVPLENALPALPQSLLRDAVQHPSQLQTADLEATKLELQVAQLTLREVTKEKFLYLERNHI